MSPPRRGNGRADTRPKPQNEEPGKAFGANDSAGVRQNANGAAGVWWYIEKRTGVLKEADGPLGALKWLQAIEEQVRKEGSLSRRTFTLAALVAAIARNATGTAALSYSRLQDTLGWRQATIRATVEELTEAGWLTVVPGDDRTRTAAAYTWWQPEGLRNHVTKSAETPLPGGGVPPDEVALPKENPPTRWGLTNDSSNEVLTDSKSSNLNEEEEAPRRAATLESVRGQLSKATFALAEREVNARIDHGYPVFNPPTLIGSIGRCYDGKCGPRCPSEVHGREAIAYHEARRARWADEAQRERAEAARRRGPTSTLPADDYAEVAAERRRQLDALEASAPPDPALAAHRRELRDLHSGYFRSAVEGQDRIAAAAVAEWKLSGCNPFDEPSGEWPGILSRLGYVERQEVAARVAAAVDTYRGQAADRPPH